MMLSRAPVSFTSGVQRLTAISTIVAELVASALAMKEAVLCSNMLTELGFGKEFEQVPKKRFGSFQSQTVTFGNSC